MTLSWEISLVINLVAAFYMFSAKLWPRSPDTTTFTYPRNFLHSQHFGDTVFRSIIGTFNIASCLVYAQMLSLLFLADGLCAYLLKAGEAAHIAHIVLDASWYALFIILFLTVIRRLFVLRPLLGWCLHRLRKNKMRATVRESALYTGERGFAPVVKDCDADIDLLVSVYAEHMDFGLLITMWDALHEQQALPEVFLRFIDKLCREVYPTRHLARRRDKDTGTTPQVTTVQLYSFPHVERPITEDSHSTNILRVPISVRSTRGFMSASWTSSPSFYTPNSYDRLATTPQNHYAGCRG